MADALSLKEGHHQPPDELYSSLSGMAMSGNNVRCAITKCPETSRFMAILDKPIDILGFFMELARVKDHTARRIRRYSG